MLKYRPSCEALIQPMQEIWKRDFTNLLLQLLHHQTLNKKTTKVLRLLILHKILSGSKRNYFHKPPITLNYQTLYIFSLFMY